MVLLPIYNFAIRIKVRKRLFTSKMKKEIELALPEMPVCPTVQGGKSNEVNRGKTFN